MPAMGHDPAATGSGRLLIKPPKQDRAGVAATTSGQIPASALDEAKRFTSHTGCRDDTDPVSQPRAGHLQHLQAIHRLHRVMCGLPERIDHEGPENPGCSRLVPIRFACDPGRSNVENNCTATRDD